MRGLTGADRSSKCQAKGKHKASGERGTHAAPALRASPGLAALPAGLRRGFTCEEAAPNLLATLACEGVGLPLAPRNVDAECCGEG